MPMDGGAQHETDGARVDGRGDASAAPAATTEARRTPEGPPNAGEGATPEPLVRGRLADVGAIVSGLLYFVAFAGFDQWWLTFVAFVPMWLVLQGQTAKRAAWLGLLTGLTMNLCGFYWLLTMLRTFSGFPTALCLVFVVIICAYQGGRLALMGWLYGRATLRGWPAPLVFAAAFAASELVYPLLFPWYYAATVHQIPVLTQVAELGGPILVGLVLIAVNLAVAEPLRAKLVAARHTASAPRTTATSSEIRDGLPMNPRVIGAGVLALIATCLFGAVRISATKARMAAAPSARVGVVQANMGLLEKRHDPNEGLKRHLRLTEETRVADADFVVWSESSVMRPFYEMEAPIELRRRFAERLGVPAIFGAVLVRRDDRHPKGYRLFNTGLATNVRGEITGRYDKQFLLAFGEYLPFGDTLPILYRWSPNSGNFTPGTSIEPVDLDVGGTKHKVSVLICYEDILPSFTNRVVAHADPELLVNMTNDAWFGDSTEPWEHLALAKFRAIEHRRYLVRGTNSGVSAIVDPIGNVVAQTGTFQEESITGEIRWLRGKTMYEMVGDAPWYVLTLGIVVAAFRKRRAPAAA